MQAWEIWEISMGKRVLRWLDDLMKNLRRRNRYQTLRKLMNNLMERNFT